ncbi:MAG: N-acetylneuraminate synthase family protein, partial [Bdellovibrionaceae bacterium]|nr:N-acetylneuraminate synthase family protein [Pseudobdellovibrionaceae bacterium]
EDHKKVAQYCASKGVMYFCTPWDDDSIQILEKMGVDLYKVASADLTNFPLIDSLIKTKKPLILSTGMSHEDEIRQTVDRLTAADASFAILHCNSTYPAPFPSINLKFMNRLREIHPIVGYSGHERGTAVSIAAVALGAKIIERHFTLDRQMEGPDHAASLEPADFKAMVDGIRQVEMALGKGEKRIVSQGEMMNRENLAKSLVAARPLKAGTVLTREDVTVKSPGRGISPRYLDQLIGTKISRNFETEDFFYLSDINGSSAQPRPYQFARPWGIPVRYYDFSEFRAKLKPKLWEFHLSYQDMEINLDDYLKGTYEEDFVVHAPELFAGSHLMDLATPDNEYRYHSIRETQRVIDITRQLKRFFPNTKRPMIVANIGGFSMDAAFPKEKKRDYYDRFAESLRELDLEGVELIPQTMAPFPWHFGGQRFQNLFVEAGEIAEICKKLQLRICLDVSHSKLTCNHLKTSFDEFVRTVGPYVAHLHIADSTGVDGEGLQVGDGEIDLKEMAKALKETAPNAWFIPEIWQGHKNGGEGVWIALDRLEGLL